MTIITKFVEPSDEKSDVIFYDDIESYTYKKVLKSRFISPDYYSEIRLKSIRFSILYSERFQDDYKSPIKNENTGTDPEPDPIASKHLNNLTVENLPYMVHVRFVKRGKVFNEAAVIKAPHVQTALSGIFHPHQNDYYVQLAGSTGLQLTTSGYPVNFDTVMKEDEFTYSTFATMTSFFNYAPTNVKTDVLSDWEDPHYLQMGWFYDMTRDVTLSFRDLVENEVIEFEVFMTNVRGKQIGRHYLPPVEMVFELV